MRQFDDFLSHHVWQRSAVYKHSAKLINSSVACWKQIDKLIYDILNKKVILSISEYAGLLFILKSGLVLVLLLSVILNKNTQKRCHVSINYLCLFIDKNKS